MTNIKTVYDASLQRTEGWYQFRLARLTGSRLHNIWAKTAYRWPKSKKELIAELLKEARTGEVTTIPVNEHMARGTRLEPVAREMATLCVARELPDFAVTDVGSCYHIDRPWLAASPDGLTSDNSVFEIKCPTVKNHMAAFYDGMATKHLAQIYAEMYTTERDGCYFISYNEEVAEDYRIYIQYVPRDEVIEKEFLAVADAFAGEFRELLVKELREVEETDRVRAVRRTWGI